ncbi:uncharacterized protein LOC114542728 [Dendronephthya gigantea]|uniref:uncharacterized protein LOC114542728 n=1 Tax=Dendronephthya gigantea TaxID=151771 RepID=UPI00106A9676|nr:uncharacterized protein LOC114542728 [Dendronephthya gigantea]
MTSRTEEQGQQIKKNIFVNENMLCNGSECADYQTDQEVKNSTAAVTDCAVNSNKEAHIVVATKKPADNARVYDRKHACTYCGELCSKIARHLTTRHKDEADVVSALTYTKNSVNRKKALTKLRLQGDYHHNMNTLETGEGELIIVRRPGQDEKKCDIHDFLPCEFCLGFFRKWDLWKHHASCEYKSDVAVTNERKHQVQQTAKLLIAPTLTGSDNITLNKILSAMNRGEIADIVRKDELIKSFGIMLLEKDGERDCQFVSQKMRELGRLVKHLMVEEKNSAVQLCDYIKPEKFDTIVKAVKETSGFMAGNGQLDVNIPSLALKLGYSIKKCASLLHNQALRARNADQVKDIKSFLKIMSTEWEYKISHHSISTLKERKYNKVQVLPLAEDIAKLRKFLDEEIASETSQLEELPIAKNWTSLAKLLLARIVMLNKRRGGEASKLLLKSYDEIPEWTKCATSEILSSLSPLEKRLSERLNMVETRGKRGRKVPIILTPEITKGIELLNSLRSKVGVNKENRYVFARVNRDSLEPLRGWDCLRQCALECQPELQNPDVITSTKLRKYIATITQVLSLEEKEMDWLARHLGHDIRTHREYYRLHESTIEIAKISKLLLAVDSGKASSLKGKSLDEISIDDISEPELTDDERGDDDGETSLAQEETKKRNAFEAKSKATKSKKPKLQKETDGEWLPEVKECDFDQDFLGFLPYFKTNMAFGDHRKIKPITPTCRRLIVLIRRGRK